MSQQYKVGARVRIGSSAAIPPEYRQASAIIARGPDLADYPCYLQVETLDGKKWLVLPHEVDAISEGRDAHKPAPASSNQVRTTDLDPITWREELWIIPDAIARCPCCEGPLSLRWQYPRATTTVERDRIHIYCSRDEHRRTFTLKGDTQPGLPSIFLEHHVDDLDHRAVDKIQSWVYGELSSGGPDRAD